MTRSGEKQKEERTELVVSENGECSHLVDPKAATGEPRVLGNDGHMKVSTLEDPFEVTKGTSAWAANNRLEQAGFDHMYVVVDSERISCKVDVETHRVLPPSEDFKDKFN